MWQLARRIVQGLLRRRKLQMCLFFVVAAIVAIPAAYRMSEEPPRFRTSATILLETRPQRLPLFQEFSPFRPLPVQLAILRSRSLAEGVVESLPKASLQELIDNPYYIDYAQTARNTYRRFRGLEPEVESPHRRALKELQQARVRFDTSKGSGIVDIVAEASKPQVAVDIVNTYIEVLLSRTRSFNVDDARVSREFLEQQFADVRKSLTTSEEALRGFVASRGGVKIPDRSQATVSQLGQAETALAEVESNRRMLEVRLQSLRDKLANQKPGPTPAAPPPPRVVLPEIQRLRAQLAQLETTLLELRTKYTEEHPRVVLVTGRIAEVQRQLGDVVKETTPATPAPASVPPAERVNFTEQVLALETSLHALAAQEEAFRKQADTLRKSLSGLSRDELEYSRLSRESEAHRSLYALISDKLTAARIREQGEMKVVKVIDPPAPPSASTGEKRLKFLALAVLASIAVGGVFPAGLEWRQRRVESEADVEAATGLPVLGMLPRVRSRRPTFMTGSQWETKQRVSEAFMYTEALRSLRITIQLAARPGGLRTILITSPHAHEGKSTIVVNLGMAFREAGLRVGLADTDFLRPTLHRTLKVQSPSGVLGSLETTEGVEESLAPVDEGMWLAAQGGRLQPRARGGLATQRLKGMVDDLSGRADIVLFDSPPVLLAPDNLFLASAVDGVVLVGKAGATSCAELSRARSLLEAVGARIVGVVINEIPSPALRPYYTRYYHAYAKNRT